MLHVPIAPRSFDTVSDLLQNTIDLSTKSQSEADGELAWLRKRLENERRELRSRSVKHEAGAKDGAPRHAPTVAQPTFADSGVQGGKENTPHSTSPGTHSHKWAPSTMSVLQLRRFLRAIGKPTVGLKPALNAHQAPSTMSVLQLRRLLRAIGKPTVGLKPALTARVDVAISSGAVRAFVESSKERKVDDPIVCVGERRKKEAMVALAESMIGGDRSNLDTPAVPRHPLPLREPAASDRNSRSSTCSTACKGGPKLSGEEQDAVVAKIRSAVERPSSSEKKLPFPDDDSPNTRGARVKKEMEDRLARQQSAKQQSSPAKPQPLNENPRAVSAPPSARPLVPSIPASVPLASPPSAVVPPPPTADAPHPSTPPKPATSPQPTTPAQATTTPPAPQSPAPRAADMAKAEVGKASAASRPLPTCNTVKDPADGEASAASRPLPTSNTVKSPADGGASAASQPLPTSNTVKGPAAGEAKAEGVKRVEGVATNAEKEKATVMVPKPSGNKSGNIHRPGGTAASGSSLAAPTNDKPASANKGFGSPGRFRTPTAKTPSRKVNPYAKDSISTPGPSGLKVAAHKALNRVNVKPSTPAPSAVGNDTHAPSSGSTTQDAFAKFRAMDSNSKKGGPSFKLRSTALSKIAPPTKHGNSHLPSHKLDMNNSFSGSRAPSSTTSKREAQEAQAAAASSKATQLAQVEAAATASRTRAALAAEKEREKARAKALAEKAAADEARREAQAKAEARAREAAFKAAAERTAKEKAVREAEIRKRKEEDRLREADKREQEKRARAIAAEALRQAELKRKEEEAKAAAAAAEAAEATAAATVAAAAAEAAVRKEAESAAAALKRIQQQKVASATKPPTPPRPSGKAPPTPPRPAPQPGAPPTPPRPPSIQPYLQAQAQAQAQSHVQMLNQAHVKTQTHVQMQAQAYVKAHEANMKAQALVQQQPLASPWTPSKIGASSAAGDKEEHQVALAKKKQEIAKRMEEMRKAQASSKPAPVAKPATTVMATSAPVASPVKSVPKEDRESYDGYEVEGDSESESGEDGEEAAQEIAEPEEPNDKSSIPDWARGKTLAKILDRQYGGPNPLNPDKIFPEFFTCNLEHIFNTKKSKWDRSSSGNWHTDRLTIAEKLAYQRAMGFDK